MKKFVLTVALSFTFFGNMAAASECKTINRFEGLIFDAASFPPDQDMERRLDQAILAGVEKLVLYPKPKGIHPRKLEQIFPDQVLQGMRPWSNIQPVRWIGPLVEESLDLLNTHLEENRDKVFLFSGPSKLPNVDFKNLLEKHPNLWLGYGLGEIEAMTDNCANGRWAKVMDSSNNRVVFTSRGGPEIWQNYLRLVSKLKKLASLMSQEKANALLYRNAENLYDLAVNAP